jgi:hypothetical protein
MEKNLICGHLKAIEENNLVLNIGIHWALAQNT